MVKIFSMDNLIANQGWTKIREKSGLIFMKLDTMSKTPPLSLTHIPPTSLLPLSHPRIWNKKPPTKKTPP